MAAKPSHPHHSSGAAWAAGLVVLAVALSLWMAWRLGVAANVDPSLDLSRLTAPVERSMPNPQPAPLPGTPQPR